MTYPMKEKIRAALDMLTLDSDINPSGEQYEAVSETLVTLIQTHGFEAEDAYKLVRSIFWRGWNQGWEKAYVSRLSNDQVQTPL